MERSGKSSVFVIVILSICFLIDFYQTCLVIMCFLIPLISHYVTEIIIVCSQSL